MYLRLYDSPESKAEYARLLTRLRTADATHPGPPVATDMTVNELLVRFLAHADGYYRHPDGTPTSEPGNFRHSLKPLRLLYGHTPAAEFGPLALKTVRQRMIDSG